jgi:hypothetical protein
MVFASVSALTTEASITSVSSGDVVLLTGYTTAGDFGQPIELIVEASTGGVKSYGPLADGRYANLYADGPVNVKWFGAKGDGSTDDSTAIQEAIDTADTAGQIVYLPASDYKIGTTLTWKVPMRGDAMNTEVPGQTGGTRLIPTTGFNNAAIISIPNGTDWFDIRDLQITDPLSVAGANCDGISTAGTSDHFYFSNVLVRLMSGDGIKIKAFIGELNNCYAMSNTGTGLQLEFANSVHVRGGEYYGNAIGVDIIDGIVVDFDGTTIEGNTSKGINGVTNVNMSGTNRSSLYFRNCYFETDLPAQHGTLDECDIVVFKGCHFGSSNVDQPEMQISNTRRFSCDDLGITKVQFQLTAVDHVDAVPNQLVGDATPEPILVSDTGGWGPLVNMVPNPNGDGGLRGWSQTQEANCTAAEETTIVRSASETSLKVTDSASGFSRCRLLFNQQSFLASNGAGRTFHYCGWVRVPSGTYSSAPGISFTYKDDGLETLGGGATATLDTDTYDEWQFISGSVTIVDDGSTLSEFGLYLRIDGTPSDTGSVYFSGMCCWEQAGGDSRLRSAYFGQYQTSEYWGRVDGNGAFIREGTAVPADATVDAEVGDIVRNTSPSDGGILGWVCTSAGSPGTWEEMGVVGLVQGSAVADLNQTIAGPSIAEVQAISDKVDELLAELRTSKIIAT